MKTVLVTAPSLAPVSLEEIKQHCIVTIDDDDAYLESLISAAVVHIEGIIGRKLISQVWKVLFDEWPDDAEILLPFGNCLAVGSIGYKQTDGTALEWAAENYVVDTDSVPGRVVIAYDKSYPADGLYHVNPITVTFTTGYGAEATSVPAPLRHAIKFMVSHWYENREVVNAGQSITDIPRTVDALIWPYRLFGF